MSERAPTSDGLSIPRELLDALPVGMFYLLPGGRVPFVNAHASALFGVTVSAEGLTHALAFGIPLREDGTPLPREEMPGVRCLVSRKNEGPVTMGLARGDDKPQLWVTAYAAPFAEGALVSFMDVTERVNAERRLRDTESRIRALVDGAFEGIIISVDGIAVEVNGALAEMLGYPRDEIIGRSAVELVAPESRDAVWARIRSGDTRPYPVEGLRKDGTRFPAELLGRNATYLGKRARVTGVRDVTAREQAAAALHRWEHVFRHAPWGIATTEADGVTIAAANPALTSKLGLAVDDLVGRPFVDRFEPAEHARVRDLLERLRVERRLQFEAEMIDAANGPFPASIDAAAVTDGEGNLLYNSFHVLDVSARRAQELERRALEQQMQHAQKLESLGVLTGGVAHDFNNLLTSVIGHAELALTDLPESSRAAASVRLGKRAAERAAELVRQMLAYAGRSPLERTIVDLNDVIRDMIELLAVSLSKKVRLELALDDALPAVEGDRSQMRQVVMNLVTNAGEAVGDAPGSIRIETSCAKPPDDAVSFVDGDVGDLVCVAVTDTGAGMDAETRRKIFEPFFTTKFTGRGLGLTALFGIVRSHGGALSVTSEPGRGSRFAVFLPRARRRIPAPSEARRVPTQHRWASGRVVLADDEELVRDLAATLLTDAGFDVVALADGRQAIDWLTTNGDDVRLVVLDATMPRLGGREVHAELRRRGSRVPVMLISGYDLRAEDGMPDDDRLAVLGKPFSRKAFYAAIEELLSRG